MYNDLKYKLALSMISGIGSINAKKLIAHFGTVASVFKAKQKDLLKVPGIGSFLAKEILNTDALFRAEKEIEFTEKHKIDVLFFLDKEYPEKLKHCEDAPIILYYKGNKAILNQQKIISIVGTRNATRYGKDNCNELIKDLKANGHSPLIVSGLAYGIDICAHQAALKNDLPTLAVLGHGLHTIYPAAHKKTAKELIAQGGGLLTEFPSNSKLDPSNFVRRNRIIAGIADATIVIESAKKGGSLITADLANSYNRDVFAFPGRLNDKYSTGCNWLIKTNRAALIESVKDIEYILGWQQTENKQAVQKQLFVELTDDEKKLLSVFGDVEELAIDIISLKADMPMSKVSALLLNLEFSGLIKSLPGKIYAKI
ncbi:MAG: DNA-processing protein DprA [Bacteroidales bacterium]|nr:DNA-processing protein DprA [Bacteroidales bacterium]